MRKKDWLQIKNEIFETLSGYEELDVTYYYPQNGECGYFELVFDDDEIYEDYDDDVESDLDDLCTEWGLDPHWDGYDTLDLNAYWDRND